MFIRLVSRFCPVLKQDTKSLKVLLSDLTWPDSDSEKGKYTYENWSVKNTQSWCYCVYPRQQVTCSVVSFRGAGWPEFVTDLDRTIAFFFFDHTVTIEILIFSSNSQQKNQTTVSPKELDIQYAITFKLPQAISCSAPSALSIKRC